MNRKPFILLFASSLILMTILIRSTQAAQTGDSVTMNFQGQFIVSAPCTINNDQVIDIPFNNIGIKKIDGVNFTQTIPYTVDCHGAPDTASVTLTVSGSVEPFDNAAVTTSASGLGIQIRMNGQPFPLNQPSAAILLSDMQSMVLTAVPVKDPGNEPTTQAFSATATLKAEYQ